MDNSSLGGNGIDTIFIDNVKVSSTDIVMDDELEDSPMYGTTISSLIDLSGGGGHNNVSDSDAGALTGIALIGIDSSHGTWWYSLNNGNTLFQVGTVSSTQALLLAADGATRLYFSAAADFSGTLTDAITFRAWDRTSGSNGDTANTSINGGATAFSTATDTAALKVVAVNDAPVAHDDRSPASTPPGPVANAANGHYYKLVADGSRLLPCRRAGHGGYLATITSAAENSLSWDWDQQCRLPRRLRRGDGTWQW